jgi:hypothetical protein
MTEDEVRVDPGYGAALVIATLMERLGETDLVLTDRDLILTKRLTWTTNIDPAKGSYIRLRLRRGRGDDRG